MNGEQIRNKIEHNNKLIEEFMTPNFFTLNNTVKDLLLENEKLQAQCPHEFEDGYCIYCYKEEN